MRNSGKQAIIKLPVNLTLTDEGEYFFNQRHRTQEYGNRGAGLSSDGLHLDTYSAKTLQRMIYAGYISRLDISRADFTSKRGEIMDVAKLIAYGVLLKEYSLKIAKVIKETTLVIQWNRKNPAKALNTAEIMNNTKRETVQGKNEQIIQDVVSSVIDELFYIREEELKSYSDEDRQMLRFKAENFLHYLNPIVWVLMARERGSALFSQTVRSIEPVIWTYLNKTNIADYLSLLVLELATLAERSLMEHAVQTYLQGRVNLEYFMKNREDRLKVLQSLSEHNEMATLSWKIQGRHGSLTELNPFQIILYNRSVEHANMRQELEDKKQLKTQGKGLSEFYENLPGDQNEQLGMYYLTYLQEECKRQGTLFDSYVNNIGQNNMTMMTLSIRF